MRRLLLGVVVLLTLGVVAAPASAQAPTIEATYAAVGPSGDAVTTGVVVDGGGKQTHRLYYPTDLGAGRHAIVAWGNGSFEHPDKYEPLLRHLASWGFIVVAAETDSAGTGQEILAGARYVIAGDTDPASPFFGHVDASHVAAVGHSQGSGGSVRAASDPSGLITTVVPVALPGELFQLLGANHDYHPDQLQVPVFFMSGALDTIISPAGAVARYYRQVPGAAAMAILNGADHNTVQVDGGGFRGYLTAWLRWQLDGDATAGGAFTGPSPELLNNGSWREQRFKGLNGPSGPTGGAASVVDLPTTASTTAAVVAAAGTPPRGALPATGSGLALVVPAALLAAGVVVAARTRRITSG